MVDKKMLSMYSVIASGTSSRVCDSLEESKKIQRKERVKMVVKREPTAR